jgi:hypothetical protein
VPSIVLRVGPAADLLRLALDAFLRAGAPPRVGQRHASFVDVRGSVPDGAEDLYALLLSALVEINILSLVRYRLPLLYRSAVRYTREKPHQEVWQSSPALLLAGTGDCEDLATHRVAELRLGRDSPPENAHVRLTRAIRSDGSRLYHVTVLREDGTVEDPSKELGMGSGES